MRLAKIGSVPARGDRWVDAAVASDRRFAHQDAVFAARDEFRARAGRVQNGSAQPLIGSRLEGPRSSALKVFGARLNCHSHLAEAAVPVAEMPLFFTKFPTCICGPTDAVVVATDAVDFEAQLAVVGREAERVRPAEAWDHRAHRWPGHQRPRPAALGAAQPGQFVPRLRTRQPVDHHARRGPRPRRHLVHLLHQRRDALGPAHVRHGLRRPPPACLALRPDHPAAGRPRLHRHGGAGPACSGSRVDTCGPETSWMPEIDALGVLTNRCVELTDPNPEQQRWRQLHPVP